MGTLQAAYRPDTARMMNHDVPWVICQYPTAALAQEAGLQHRRFRGAALRRRAPRLGSQRESGCAASRRTSTRRAEIRIVGAGTDLRLSLERGRERSTHWAPTCRRKQVPSAARFEDSAEGEISFRRLSAVYRSREVGGIRLTLQGGIVVDASAETNEDYLLADARHRRGRAPPRRARDRLQPRNAPAT